MIIARKTATKVKNPFKEDSTRGGLCGKLCLEIREDHLGQVF